MPWANATYDKAAALDWIAACASARADGSAHEFGIFRQRVEAGTAVEQRGRRTVDKGANGASGGTADSASGYDGLHYVGAAGLNQFNRAHNFCNLGYWVRTSAQRQGAGCAAIRALVRFAFEELGQTRVEIVVADGNHASLALARKAGAVHEGLARNRLRLHDGPVTAHVLSLVPERAAAAPVPPDGPARR
jgi:L-amino acid N-acyltransferase YncA